jgi:phage/plasmid-like protein (TIGR03299 family)
MPANVLNMAYFGKTPWHGKGNPLDATQKYSIDELLVLTGGNYDVEIVPQFTFDTDLVDGIPTEVKTQTSQILIRRSDNRKHFGFSGKEYRPYQNKDAFSIFEPLIDSGDMSFETGGVLGDGEICWFLAQVNLSPFEVVKGDEVRARMLLANFHDGLRAIKFGKVFDRVVCQNTLALALGNNLAEIFRVKHNSKTKVNIESLRDSFNQEKLAFEMNVEKYRFLASKGVNEKDLMRFVKIVNDADPEKHLSELSTRKQNIIDRCMTLIESGMGQDNPLVHGTWWAAYNGVNQYLNFEKGNTQDKRLENLWFGNENKKTFDTALAFALAV